MVPARENQRVHSEQPNMIEIGGIFFFQAGQGTGSGGGVWCFPGIQTGLSWSLKGASCVFVCVGESSSPDGGARGGWTGMN